MLVLIARGMMDTGVVGWNVFHGTRTGDVDVAVRALRRGLASLTDAHGRPRQKILAGVWYSMGECGVLPVEVILWTMGSKKKVAHICTSNSSPVNEQV